jgi:hypothetical protein
VGRSRGHGAGTPNARRFPALESATPEALAYIHAAFERVRLGAGPTWRDVIAQLAERFGIDWNDSGLSRYYAYWSSNLYVLDRAQEHSRDLVDAYKAQPTREIEEQIRQELTALRLLSLRGLESSDPVEVAKLGQNQDKIELRREMLALDRKRVELLERKLAAYEAKAAAADKQVADLVAARELTPEVAGKIREMYGLAAEGR